MSTELVVGIGSRESPDHMIAPTNRWERLTQTIEDYLLNSSTKKAGGLDPALNRNEMNDGITF